MTQTNFRTNTWERIGTRMNEKNINDVITKAHLDYNVLKTPIFSKLGEKTITYPDRVLTVKEETGDALGIVSPSYVPVQNKDAFDFINYIDDDITFVKAGETTGGLVYVIGELNEMNILGDKFKTYAIFQNSHNGRYPLAMSICPLRIVCQNQFNVAFKESNSTFLIRHTRNAESKLALAADTLNSISHYMHVFNEKAQLFAAQKVNEHSIAKFLNFMFPTNDTMSEKTIEKVELEKAKFIKAYDNEDNRNFRGSAWGLINGLTDYITHQEYKRKVKNAEEKRFVETILVANNLNAAVNYIQELAV